MLTDEQWKPLIEQGRALLAEAEGQNPRIVSPVVTCQCDIRSHPPRPDLWPKGFRAQFELTMEEGEKVLLLRQPMGSAGLQAMVALVDHVVERGRFMSGKVEHIVRVARVGNMWFGADGYSSRVDGLWTGTWITKAICANILLEHLLWLPREEKVRCWSLINPDQEYPDDRLLF